MKKILVITIFLLIFVPTAVFAQTPQNQGNGDGNQNANPHANAQSNQDTKQQDSQNNNSPTSTPLPESNPQVTPQPTDTPAPTPIPTVEQPQKGGGPIDISVPPVSIQIPLPIIIPQQSTDSQSSDTSNTDPTPTPTPDQTQSENAQLIKPSSPKSLSNNSAKNPLADIRALAASSSAHIIRPPFLSLFTPSPGNYYEDDHLSPLETNFLTTVSILLLITGVFLIRMDSARALRQKRREIPLKESSLSYIS